MFQIRTKINAARKNLTTHCTAKRFTHKEHKIRVNNLDINIVESGCGDKSVLLMPGAVGSSWTDFQPQIEQLPKILPNHTIIAWDPPGFGKSIPPKRQWSHDMFHKDAYHALDLMKTLGKTKFSIIGWSGGGITGLIAAGLFRENIEKLIVWGSTAYLVAQDVQGFENLRDVRKFTPNIREAKERLYGVEGFAELWSQWVDTVSELYKERNGNFCKQEVKLITAPTLILHGSKDPIISTSSSQYLRENIKHAR